MWDIGWAPPPQTLAIDGAGQGALTVGPLGDAVEVLVIFTNLGDGSRDPELPHCAMGNGFVYDLTVEDLAAPAQVTGVDPAELTAGEDHYLWVAGESFVDGLTVAFGGEGITVTQVNVIDGETIGVPVQVASDAPSGSQDLTITNPNAEQSTLAGAVTVVDGDGSTAEVTRCGCRLVGDDPTQPQPWRIGAMLAGLALLLSRRRR